MQHRGCNIRAASYEVSRQSWLPEACVWLQTDTGLHKVWVHSFAHCFDAEKLTFPNKLDADNWALGAAKSIIDRALEQLQASTVMPQSEDSQYVSRIWDLKRHASAARRWFGSTKGR
jgi:hypothetical protein